MIHQFKSLRYNNRSTKVYYVRSRLDHFQHFSEEQGERFLQVLKQESGQMGRL